MGKKKKIQLAPGCAIYLRTSSEDAQAPERSLNAQRRQIQDNVLNPFNLEVVEEYTDIFSGRATDRQNYQRLLADARQGKFAHVAIALIDRFGRNTVEGLRAIDELTDMGIRVHVANIPTIDASTDDGRLVFDMMFSMARFESARIGTRTKGGMREKYLAGSWPHNVPDGYRNREYKTSDGSVADKYKHARYKRWVELDPVQGPIWRQAWDLLLSDRYTLREICEELNSRGHRLRTGTPFARTRKSDGQRMYALSVMSRNFRNWMYAGWVVVSNDIFNVPPKTIKAEWEPVVSTEEFEAGLVILDRRKRTPEPKKRHFYLLQGLVYLQEETK